MTRGGWRNEVRVAALAGLFLFLAIVAVEHAANFSLDPATHRISEYVNGRLGWLMVVGFAAWAISLAATAVAATRWTGGRGMGIALFAAALGMTITACFATQTSAGELPPGASLTLSGRLHDIGSGLVTLALAVAVLLSLREGSARLRRFTLVLLVSAFPLVVALVAIGDDVAGIRQRLLVAIACVWQLFLLTEGGSVSRIGGSYASSTSGPRPSIR
jgi:hypothetical protein